MKKKTRSKKPSFLTREGRQARDRERFLRETVERLSKTEDPIARERIIEEHWGKMIDQLEDILSPKRMEKMRKRSEGVRKRSEKPRYIQNLSKKYSLPQKQVKELLGRHYVLGLKRVEGALKLAKEFNLNSEKMILALYRTNDKNLRRACELFDENRDLVKGKPSLGKSSLNVGAIASWIKERSEREVVQGLKAIRSGKVSNLKEFFGEKY